VHRPESSGVGAEHVFATLWQGRALFDACGYVAGRVARSERVFSIRPTAGTRNTNQPK